MTPAEAVTHLNKEVEVNNPKISGKMLFTAYIFRIKDNKKIYQAEVRNLQPPHEIYVISLNDLEEIKDERTTD